MPWPRPRRRRSRWRSRGRSRFRDRLVDASQPVIEESPRKAGLRTQAIVAHTRIEEQLDDRRPRAARVEELERRKHEPGPVVDPPPRPALGDPRHQVRALSLQRLEPLQLVAVDPVLVHLTDHTSKPLQERPEDRVALARGRGQLPLRVLADRLQHPVAVTAPRRRRGGAQGFCRAATRAGRRLRPPHARQHPPCSRPRTH